MTATEKIRGIRGATTVDDPGDVPAATVELLDELLAANECAAEDVAGVLFTVTGDLAGTNPAGAAREGGFDAVPMLVSREHADDPPRCIRVLVLFNTLKTQHDIRHVYLREAASLRPELTGKESR